MKSHETWCLDGLPRNLDHAANGRTYSSLVPWSNTSRYPKINIVNSESLLRSGVASLNISAAHVIRVPIFTSGSWTAFFILLIPSFVSISSSSYTDCSIWQCF